jgi:hypothetical protein
METRHVGGSRADGRGEMRRLLRISRVILDPDEVNENMTPGLHIFFRWARLQQGGSAGAR